MSFLDHDAPFIKKLFTFKGHYSEIIVSRGRWSVTHFNAFKASNISVENIGQKFEMYTLLQNNQIMSMSLHLRDYLHNCSQWINQAQHLSLSRKASAEPGVELRLPWVEIPSLCSYEAKT